MIMMLIPMLLLLCFMLMTLYMATQTILTTTVRIVKTDIESKIALELQDQTEPTIEQYKALVKGISTYFRDFSGNREFKKNLLVALLWVFGTGVLLIIVQIVMLSIFFSHRIAGPVYRLEKTCHGMIGGVYNEEINLRKSDELKNLALLLNEANSSTCKRLRSLSEAKTDEDRERIVKDLRF